MSEPGQSVPTYSSNNLEEELLSLKKHVRVQEAEWKKNKAVLEQRIEILELQNRELKEREENLKKMNNSIYSALKDLNKENDPTYNKIIKELEASKQEVSKEFAEHKIRSQETIRNLEKENKELKEKISEIESKYNLMALHYEKNDAALQQKVQDLENEKKNISSVLKLYEEERNQFKEKELNQNELVSKLTEVRYLLEKQANDHRKEIEVMHREYTQTINNMKLLAESEKSSLENEFRKLLESRKLDGGVFEEMKKKYQSEMGNLRRDKDNLIKRNESLEQQIAQLNETQKALEDKLTEQRFVTYKAEQDKDVKELKKLKLKMMDTENLLRKYEQSEKNLKQMVTEMEYKLEEASAEFKKKLGNEKRRYEQTQEIAKKHKEESERRCAMIMQENIKKDEIIKKLKGQLRTHEEKLAQKMGNDANKSDTSLVNMSLINQSLSKYHPSRSFIQEVKTTRDASSSKSIIQAKKGQQKLSRNYTQKILEKDPHRQNTDPDEDEENSKELNNENILMGLNSPRTFNSVRTSRNHPSNKKEKDGLTTAVNKNVNKDEKPVLSINLFKPYDQDLDMNEREAKNENMRYSQRDNNLNTTIADRILDNVTGSFELKKKSASICEGGPSYAVREIRDNTPNRQEGRSFLSSHDFGENLSVKNSNNNMKGTLSMNRSASNLSRPSQNIFGNKADTSAVYQNPYDFPEGIVDRPHDDKIKELEERLHESEQTNEKLALEKERLQVDLDRLILELKQTKMEWALSEESKEECELALKNEIKFLINKLLQVKNSGPNSSLPQADVSQQFTKSTLNKSAMDPQLSSMNISGFSNFSQFNPSNHSTSFISSLHDQNNINNNNYGADKGVSDSDKKTVKKLLKGYSEADTPPLQNRCLNSDEFDRKSESPRRVSEFNNNENSLLMNLLNTNTNPKKLICNLKR